MAHRPNAPCKNLNRPTIKNQFEILTISRISFKMIASEQILLPTSFNISKLLW